MTYCPLRLLGSEISKKPGDMSIIPGGFNSQIECAQALCGFWCKELNRCGLSVTNIMSSMPHPVPIKNPTEEEDSKTVLNPEVSA
jgi:hypothetical protein